MDSCIDIDAVIRAELPYVIRLARRLRVPPSHAEDVAQEVFLRLHRQHPDGLVPGSRVKPLLRAGTFGAAGDLQKKLRYRSHSSLDEGGFEPMDHRHDAEQSASDAEQCDRAYDVLDGMDDDLRAVFVAHEIEGMTLREVAEMTGSSINTIAGRLSQAREAFRKAVDRRAAEERRKYKVAGALFLPLSADSVVRALRAAPATVLPGAEERVLAAVHRAIESTPTPPTWFPRRVADLLRSLRPNALTFGAGVAVGAALVGLRCDPKPPALVASSATPAALVAVTVSTDAPLPSIAPSATASGSPALSVTVSASAPRRSPDPDPEGDTRCFQRARAFLDGNPRETLRLLTMCDQQYPTTLRPQRARLRREAEALAHSPAPRQ